MDYKIGLWLIQAIAGIFVAGCGGGGGDLVPATPNAQTASATVGTAGGTVATGDATATAVFPPNAFAADTTVTIAPSASAPANARLVSGTAFDFGPSGNFAQPARVTLKYLPANLPAGALESHLVMYTVAGGVWQPVAGSTVDTATHAVLASVTHFSSYALLADNQFAGSYSGTYGGGSSGTWAATVDTAGAIAASATGGFTGTGTVNFTGASTIPLAGSGSSQGFAITFGGNFSLASNGTSVSAAGTWSSSSGLTGTWLGDKAAAGSDQASSGQSIASGFYHSCALSSGGGVKCWGGNTNGTIGTGQLGDGTVVNRLAPVDVVGLSSGVVAVAAGAFHSCALTSAGGVKCWGQNGGALGDGTTQTRLTPVDVVGLGASVKAISAGGTHTCVLTTVGGVKCWGAMGGYGLGDGTSLDRSTPVDVVGLTSGVLAVSVGNAITCALTSAGGVKCWGGNGAGALGDGTTTNRLIPVDVSGLTSGVIAVAASGGGATCAVTTLGGLKCWGNNGSGAIGDGTTTSRLTAVDVVGLSSGVTAVSVGQVHTCAVTIGGGVKCWGASGFGNLGDGTSINRLTPVDVVGLGAAAFAVSTGVSNTCAATSNAGYKCWGFNQLGSLGDGTGVTSLVPVNVVGF